MTHGEVLEISLRTTVCAIALFSAASLLSDRLQRGAAWGLALFLLIAALDSLAELVRLWGYLPQLFWLAGLEPLFVFLYGPAIYLYVLKVTGTSVSLRWIIGYFGLPLCLGAQAVLGFLTLPYPVQLSLLNGSAIENAVLAERAMSIASAAELTFLGLTFGFVVACWLAMDENLRRLSGLFSSIEDHALGWLRWVMVLIVVALGWAAAQGALANAAVAGEGLQILDAAVTLAWVALLANFGIRQRPVFQEATTSAVMRADPEPSEKYARSALDSDRMHRLADRMLSVMRHKALHRDPGLSLRGLSETVGASANYVSQTLNDHLGVSFFDFVNGFRVDEAETLLRKTGSSVTDIALQVGFNSRSTFNAAVRKHRGLSPTELRAGS